MWNPPIQHRGWLIAGAGVWILFVAIGMKSILDYESRPGTAAKAPNSWPATSRVPRQTGRPMLLMFAHPRCPCTRASLGELERVVAQSHGRLDVYVLFAQPRGVDPNWVRADRWREAASIPGVRLFTDSGGAEEVLFGTSTSGQVLFYDAEGRLRFAGGITPGRGHAGDNAGADAIVALADGNAAAYSTTPVFGCQLCAPSSASKGTTACPK